MTTSQFGLFAPPAAEPKPERSDVKRVLEHRDGPFVHSVRGREPRQYRVLELVSGTFAAEFLDNGERSVMWSLQASFVSRCLLEGEWKAVQG